MINTSKKYKKMMSNPIRERAYASVGIGVVNQDAQEDAKATGVFSYYSQGNIFDTNQLKIDYAAFDERYLKTDGSMYFVPENNELLQLKNNGITSEEYLSQIKVEFSQIYALKGLTIDFGFAYPTEFEIESANNTFAYLNDKQIFTTEDTFGDTDYLIIRPIKMVGGLQKLRIKSMLMGIGLAYSNVQIQKISLSDFTSAISEELPSAKLSVNFYDEEERFNVDDESSFIGFLETMQKINLSFGVTLEDETVEWNHIATMYLKSWKSQKGTVSISATDRLSQMNDTYSLGNKIYKRTAYEEAESIFLDAGLEPDEYYIDEYLNDVELNNPMPKGTHKSCLQLLANACRCIIKQDRNGKTVIKANFANVLDPSDLQVETNGIAPWSKPANILYGSNIVYSEFAQNFIPSDGTMYFLPEDSNYLETSYVSDQTANENGMFEINPKITLTMPAAYSYYNVSILFDGNVPEEVIVHTYNENTLLESTQFNNLEKESVLIHDFLNFNKIVFEFTKGYPLNRVLVNQISFGDLTDYKLTRDLMTKNPVGYKEKRVKAIQVKLYTFVNNEKNEPQEVKDEIYYIKTIGDVGETKTLKNPLISDENHAEIVGEWIGNYYANNISYDVEYRGEPRIEASDIIYMESEKINNLQVEITNHTLNYNGAFSGSLELRRALKMMGG